MAGIYDLYGITDTDIDTAARLLPDALGLPFEPHESSFWGDYYSVRTENYDEHFSLKENYNVMEEDWNWSQFKHYPLMLEVSIDGKTMKRARELEARLLQTMGKKIILLKRVEFAS
ncbi:hypothetical protein [Dictyobacter aurantiacus]|uniref:Uncharacterized protein n=1 Tax=Dictyobacter aurantiacus TaxID=1936993 RepID=A0A401ZIV7_9CHLR|nr:hypothetical protein [Dictyobacter aurantiacus]GCE06764.1 hypothetical protein KDAU_40930 [Dictyobacter aurantiacus]